MTGRDRASGRALARAAALLLRAYSGLGGPMLSVIVFLTTARVWLALGLLVPWFILARFTRGLDRG